MICISGYSIARKEEHSKVYNEKVRGSKYEYIPFQIEVKGLAELNHLRKKLKELHSCDVFMVYKEK